MDTFINESEYARSLIEASLDPLVTINADGKIMDVNGAMVRITDKKREKLIDTDFKDYFTDPEKAREVYQQVFAKGFVTDYPLTIIDGVFTDVLFNGSVFKNKHGKVLGAVVVARDITERKKAELEIIKTADQLRHLTTHLQTVREEERKRIGREIHDELGQQLTAIKMDTVWINKHIPTETVAIKNKLQNIIALLDRSHGSVRKILNELLPAMLDENGILEALQWQGQQFTENTGTPLHFSSNQSSIKLSQETATCIFRLFQESLTNIMRYAVAGKVLSSLNVVNDSIILRIEDDGKGFDPSITKSDKSFGLLGMKERALSLNGKFELLSSPGKGTIIEVTLPYNNTLLEEKVSKMKRKS